MDYPQKKEIWTCSDGSEFTHHSIAVAYEKELKPDVVVAFPVWDQAVEELACARDEAWAEAKHENNKAQHERNSYQHGIAEGKKLAYAHALRVIEALKGE